MSNGKPKLRTRALEIYALTACLGALSFFAIDAGIGIYHVIGAACPTLTVGGWDISRHESDEAFLEDLNYRQRLAEGKPVPPRDQIPAMRAASWARTLRRERLENLVKTLETTIGVLVGLTVFVIHWRIASRARQEVAA